MGSWTPEREREARARLRAATPGPWTYIAAKTLIHVETDIDNPHGAGRPVCSIPKSRERDADLLMHTPTDLQDALAEIERLRKLAIAVLDARRRAEKSIGFALIGHPCCGECCPQSPSVSQGFLCADHQVDALRRFA